MSQLRVAVIGTFYGRHENTPGLVRRLYVESSRRPHEAWLIGESSTDRDHITRAWLDLIDEGALPRKPRGLKESFLPTPLEAGRYKVIPYSRKINWALDRTTADLILYLDNGSMPHPDKILLMARELAKHPEWGAVYCAQHRTGYQDMVAPADQVVEDGFCAVNYTQVMHRRTADRWPLDMKHADPDLADGLFWRELHKTLGPFHPVAPDLILDTHHMPDAKAQGL